MIEYYLREADPLCPVYAFDRAKMVCRVVASRLGAIDHEYPVPAGEDLANDPRFTAVEQVAAGDGTVTYRRVTQNPACAVADFVS